MGRMERYRGHFYNWYDTRSLKPLQPMYVSTVDSGNLAGFLLVLRSGLLELQGTPLLKACDHSPACKTRPAFFWTWPSGAQHSDKESPTPVITAEVLLKIERLAKELENRPDQMGEASKFLQRLDDFNSRGHLPRRPGG